MLGTAFPSGALGGPGAGTPRHRPRRSPTHPTSLVHLAWVVLALVVVYLALRRSRTLRAWVLLGAYLLVLGCCSPVSGAISVPALAASSAT